MKSFSGLSISTISINRFLCAIVNGKNCLHSSQSNFLNLITTYPLCIFIVRFVSNHPFRHFRWIEDMVPVQLHGEINGLKAPLSSTSSEPQHILHWGWVEEEFMEFCLIIPFSDVCSCFDFVKAIWFCCFLIKIEDWIERSSPAFPKTGPSIFSNWSLFLYDWLP